jgi:hypothetical protein
MTGIAQPDGGRDSDDAYTEQPDEQADGPVSFSVPDIGDHDGGTPASAEFASTNLART